MALRDVPKKGLNGPVRAVIACGGLLASATIQSDSMTSTAPVTTSPLSQARKAALAVSK
jgi:hypothetical protein